MPYSPAHRLCPTPIPMPIPYDLAPDLYSTPWPTPMPYARARSVSTTMLFAQAIPSCPKTPAHLRARARARSYALRPSLCPCASLKPCGCSLGRAPVQAHEVVLRASLVARGCGLAWSLGVGITPVYIG